MAWDRLGDTDFLNRAAEAGAVSFSPLPRQGGAPAWTGTMAGPLGMSMSFSEVRNGWVRHRWFLQERVFRRSPIATSRFRLGLEPDGDGVVPHLSLEVEPASALFAPLVNARSGSYRTRWQAVLDALPAPGEPPKPALVREAPPELRAALQRWSSRAPAGVVDAVGSLFLEERPRALRELRAYDVADRFGLDRDETLVAMLRAVPAGVLELYWSVRCGRCRGEVSATTSLSDLADHAECTSCGVGFATDLGESVEVLFAPHPAVSPPRTADCFCTMFPSGSPTLYASLPLEPGEQVEEEVDLQPGGRFGFGAGHGHGDLEVAVGASGVGRVEWAPGREGEVVVAAGRVRLSAANPTGATQRVLLSDRLPDSRWVPASRVATLPEFRRELGVQVLSRNIRIGTRSVALLFTDLSGSTSMYESRGDAAAYGLVRDHFQLLREAVEAHRGEVVKTMGDAVMASFHSADAGLAAALGMRRAFAEWMATAHPEAEVRLNVGLHVGPALAVHSDAAGGVDWFGRHVNLAARAQSAARDGALVLTEAVMEDPLARERLLREGLQPEPFLGDLKGIGEVRLFRLA